MHGTGQFSSLITMNLGRSVVTLPNRKFDAGELWRTCQDRHVNSLIIVGDAFARPMVQALDANPGKWDLVLAEPHLLVRRDVEPRGEGRSCSSTSRT